eukprot:2615728-Rhodomonas_salina.1
MQPGRKRQQLEAALVQMRRDVIAMRRLSVRPQRTHRAVRARMVLRIPRPRLRFRPPVTPPA